MSENDLKSLKTKFPDNWNSLNNKLANPYENFKSIDDYQKPVSNLRKEDFYSKLKKNVLVMKKRKEKNIKQFSNKNGEELNKLYLKSDVILLTCEFEKFTKISNNEAGINPLYSVSLPGWTWQCDLKYTDFKLQILKDKDMIQLLETNVRGGISSVMGDWYVKSDDNKKILYIDANILYGHSMSQPLPYDDFFMIKLLNWK